ncbi:FeoB-associated Cys-rich membrane protein [uncultured Desulfosarcina sp.]|uniref:FeoB-associated Cys-rich membrane protein n=1 Tax=uncultured Desulfosarcina sp. TaxID=218289 RepID=UPI0029C6A9D6|nr:FeoB-associated Cys-rich membrane protein [uncultured Desulfosarcina sp.]
MQTVIVVLSVVAAAVYLGRVFYKSIKQTDGCSCGCAGCGISDACSHPESGRSGDGSMDSMRR